MTPGELRQRFRAFALRCIKLADSFPNTCAGKVVAGQLIRASTGAAANYHAACAARSHRDFLNKLGIVEEESDESLFWITFAVDAALARESLVADLVREADELKSIIVASEKTAKTRRRERPMTSTPHAPAGPNRKSKIGNRKSQ